MLSLGIPDSAV